MLLQPAEVTKPSYPGSYDGSWATLHREAKNSSDWAAGREWTQTALTGWAAFMVRNDDSAVTSMACVHGWGVASFTAISPFSFQLSSLAGTTHQQPEEHICMHTQRHTFLWLCTHCKKAKTRSQLQMWAAAPRSLRRTVTGIALQGDYHLLASWCHSNDLPAPVLPIMTFGSQASACREKATVTESQSNSH